MKRDSPRPRLDLGAIRRESVGDYIIRFGFGAGVSAIAAVAAIAFGPRLGGILLAFPAILPASLTLIEHKAGRHEAAVDATGAVIGAVALVVFAIVAAWTLARFDAVPSVLLAGLSWLITAVGIYVVVTRFKKR
jgi:uncharacterized protein DUF3147